MTTNLFDAHNHLQDHRLADDLPMVMQRARLSGVAHFACCGTNETDWPQVEALAGADGRIVPSFGLHPWFIEQRTRAWLDTLESFLKRNPAAGVGEIGLDHALTMRRDDEQAELVQSQLALARRLKRPVSMHCRRAWASLLQVLDSLGPLPAGFVIHSYSGSPEFIAPICARGGYVSFSGSVTSPRNRRAQASCLAVPEDRLLVETDAPDLKPSIAGSQTSSTGLNEPANLVYVLAALAHHRGQPMERLAESTTRNACRLFGVT